MPAIGRGIILIAIDAKLSFESEVADRLVHLVDKTRRVLPINVAASLCPKYPLALGHAEFLESKS
jgi:hypothetical protein